MKYIKHSFFLIITTGFFVHANAQWYKSENVDKAAFEMFLQAYEYARYDEFDKALPLLDKALSIDNRFVEAYIGKANIFAKQKKYAIAVAEYEKAKGLDSIFFKTYMPAYAHALAGDGKFARALAITDVYLSDNTLSQKSKNWALQRKKTYEFAVANEKLVGHHYNFAPTPISDSINSKNLEYYPSFTIDANKIIFTRRIGNSEDFYESNYVNGSWQKAQLVKGAVNTPYDEGAQSISVDGKMLVFAGCRYPKGFGSCDLYVSYLDDKGEWSVPANLGAAVNTEFWETAPSIAPDKQSIYFASNRPGGFGGSDIWVTKFADGRWQKAINLGALINTKGDEASPFIHTDNETLYFSSNGHLGYGGNDLFVAKKNENGAWDTPVNLGYPINTIDEEAAIVILADGKTAWYASDRLNIENGLDIFTFQLREDIAATKTIWVKGKIFDKATGKPLVADIELSSVADGKMISLLASNGDGTYMATLPQGKDYAFAVNKKGYLFYSENFSLKTHIVDSVAVIDIALQKIEKGAKVLLKNIFFDTKQTALKPESQYELNKLVSLMQENPGMKIQVEGHTDNVGAPKDNMQLSIGRALAVKQYLISKGIAAGRVSHKGFGETKPIAGNTTEEGKAKNRRTEILVL